MCLSVGVLCQKSTALALLLLGHPAHASGTPRGAATIKCAIDRVRSGIELNQTAECLLSFT
jgi:hypothetical protein